MYNFVSGRNGAYGVYDPDAVHFPHYDTQSQEVLINLFNKKLVDVAQKFLLANYNYNIIGNDYKDLMERDVLDISISSSELITFVEDLIRNLTEVHECLNNGLIVVKNSSDILKLSINEILKATKFAVPKKIK